MLSLAAAVSRFLGPRRPRAPTVRYSIDEDSVDPVWFQLFEEMVPQLSPRGSEEERLLLAQSLAMSIGRTTQPTYLSKLRLYWHFCQNHSPVLQAFPADTETLTLFCVHLASRLSMDRRAIDQHLSVVNTFHALFGLPKPRQEGDLLHYVLQGLDRLLISNEQRKARLPLLPQMIKQMLDLTLDSSSVYLVRDLVACATGFLFLFRGSTLATLAADDVSILDSCIKIKPSTVKGQSAAEIQTKQFFCTSDHLYHKAMMRFQSLKQSLQFKSPLFFALPGEDDSAFAEPMVDVWLNHSLQAIGVASFAEYSSHSLRIGGCSTMFSIEIADRTIRFWGGWKNDSVLDMYIRPIPVQPEAHMFFGWCKTHRPTAQGQV